MSDQHIMKAMFTQQRIQIMHLGKHHEEYTDAYIFAWESGVYPFLHDLGGEHQYLPHELYGDFFEVSAQKGASIYERLNRAWADEEDNLTYSRLESDLMGIGSSREWRPDEVMNVCRYLFLTGCFDEVFWKALCKPTADSSWVEFVRDVYSREHDTAFM
ncbi:hypothetical protein [Citrobacter sp. UYEF32]|uniref:hypothetical protein n=1 Tax=Citrobacter sp. UYEF32 TaxID=3156347 RepID=UPI0033955670